MKGILFMVLDSARYGVRSYWIPGVMALSVVVMITLTVNQSQKNQALESDVATAEELLTAAEETEKAVSVDFDETEHQEQLENRTVSARKIGEEMIAVDDTLTAYYKTAEPLPEDDKKREAMFEKLEAAQEENTRLTGAGQSAHIETWQLNPDWTLELDSVVTYQDTNRVPVVFNMTTKDGDAAGLIYAVYDVESHMLDNITRHYTTDGLKDEAALGGR